MKPSLAALAAAILLCSCAQREDPGDVAAAQGERQEALLANEASAARANAEAEKRAALNEQASWSIQGDEAERTIAYGPAEGAALLTAQCDGTNREIIFSRAVQVAAGQIDMKIGTGAQIKVFQADAQSEPAPGVTGRLPATDPVVEAIAQGTEPMSVQVGDGDLLLVPSGGPFKQLIEECA